MKGEATRGCVFVHFKIDGRAVGPGKIKYSGLIQNMSSSSWSALRNIKFMVWTMHVAAQQVILGRGYFDRVGFRLRNAANGAHGIFAVRMANWRRPKKIWNFRVGFFLEYGSRIKNVSGTGRRLGE